MITIGFPARLIKTGLLLTFLCNAYVHAQTVDSLRLGFKNPPADAWPRTWWHWTRSNVSKEGITKDLEWMKRAGIAGFQLADVNAGGGQTVKDPVIFGTAQWLDAVKHAASEADRLGLEMAIFSSPGWSLTGGPWVKPEQAMKKLVWSELEVEGGVQFSGKLPSLPSNEGAGPDLQNNEKKTNGFYRDFAVIAFRTPADENNKSFPRITNSNRKEIENAGALMDNDLATTVTIRPYTDEGFPSIQLNYDQPFTAKAITIAGRRGIPVGRVAGSKDGSVFFNLLTLPGISGYRGGNIRTYAFPETTVKCIRIEFTNAALRPADVIAEVLPAPDTAYVISEVRVHGGARINRWEDQAGFNFLFDYSSITTPAATAQSSIDTSAIIDLTGNMNAEGTLQWKVPAGKWTIMRFGYALTGAKNRPAIPAALGYEVDKMNPEHVTAYMKAYTDPLKQSLGDLYGKRLQYFLLDSWEAGIQNWTDIMPAEFKKRRKYDIINYLPALTGRVVHDVETSERFLWDFRRTLVDLVAENHYGTITEFLHKQGIKTYGEAGGVSLESIEDALLNKKYVDIPMGEFWVRDLHPSSMYYEDVRGAASSSHIYGKKLVAAEAFTGGNFESPQTLKNIADYWFTQGVNRLVFHTSAHQPLDTRPGNTMVGTHLHRNITWAEQMKPLTTYLARNSFMLQRGQYVADIAYLLDEGAPSTMPFWGGGLQPAVPAGYQFDYINADALNGMSVDKNGKLTLPGGMTYSILVLPQANKMSFDRILKIKGLLESGATIVGPRPVQALGLFERESADISIKNHAVSIWGDLDGISRTKGNYHGGKIFWGRPLGQVLMDIGIAKDAAFNYDDEYISWIHRREGDRDIYFVVNRKNIPLTINGRFRVTGRDVELWHPGDGSAGPASYTMDSTGTMLDLQLTANEAVFIVFQNRTSQQARSLAKKQYTQISELTGTWSISFPKGLGAPGKIQLQKLTSWTENSEEGVKYFSGTGTYSKMFEIKKEWLKPGMRLTLDLGDVKDMAEVYVNDKRLDLLWKVPFEIDITNAIKAGSNKLEIKVTNQWTNRLAGDRDHPGHKVLDSWPQPFGRRQYDLAPSGLIGPVRLLNCNGCD